MYKAIRQKLLSFLDDNLFYLLKEGDSFYDGFCGSGIVSQHIAENYSNIDIYAGDLSEYSRVLFNILNIGSVFQHKEDVLNIFKEAVSTSMETKELSYRN